ncbi:hypothetical protein OB955_00665 [Halobacteria archaeon AArc-m2/3/4]|uniref:Uncharacterized protein n=1 Tax=Natronoglomus mannanivorans TaxID=2979990 RepID=A0AAP3E1Z7_9EURY|nr:hypothetical protein [Halobacteria archaeon AArc-xg1-1]MCU4971250.1 hypothetical protein [Halobacteria archaeon AArc-m2/3/4]
MTSRPAIIAVDDDLASIESTVSGDPQTAVAEARTSLEEFANSEATSRARSSHLDDADAALLRAQEQTSDRPARRLEAIRNRIQIYRESVSQTGEDLAVIESTIRVDESDDGRRDTALTEYHDETVELVATVVNGGIDRRVVLAVTFYDETGTELDDAATDEHAFGADEQATISLEVRVPDGAAYYTVTALDGQTQTVG